MEESLYRMSLGIPQSLFFSSSMEGSRKGNGSSPESSIVITSL